ncbi:aminotransferase class IV [Echinicola sediminis]
MSEFNSILIKPGSPSRYEVIGHENANRAAFFGDGLFETMIFQNNKIRFADEHHQRLQEGLKQLKINPQGISTIGALENYLKTNFSDIQPLRIRWNVFRSGLGKYTPVSNNAQEIILIQAHAAPPKIKEKAYISREIKLSQSPWSHCKTLNALPYVMANIERSEKGMDEVILLDNRSMVSEAGAANIFWIKNNRYYTPSLSCSCIGGVGRKVLIDHLRANGITVLEGEFTTDVLLDADQVFTTNVTGIAYIKKIMETGFDTTPIPMIELIFQ